MCVAWMIERDGDEARKELTMRVRRIFLVLAVASVAATMLVVAGPASAQSGHTSCKAFGQNIAELATSLGRAFGQTAAASAPLNDTVDAEQAALCEPSRPTIEGKPG